MFENKWFICPGPLENTELDGAVVILPRLMHTFVLLAGLAVGAGSANPNRIQSVNRMDAADAAADLGLPILREGVDHRPPLLGIETSGEVCTITIRLAPEGHLEATAACEPQRPDIETLLKAWAEGVVVGIRPQGSHTTATWTRNVVRLDACAPPRSTPPAL